MKTLICKLFNVVPLEQHKLLRQECLTQEKEIQEIKNQVKVLEKKRKKALKYINANDTNNLVAARFEELRQILKQ